MNCGCCRNCLCDMPEDQREQICCGECKCSELKIENEKPDIKVPDYQKNSGLTSEMPNKR